MSKPTKEEFRSMLLAYQLDNYRTAYDANHKQLQEIRMILQEITEGKGRYNRDNYTHACNTIEDMKALAVKGLQTYPDYAEEDEKDE